MTKDFLSCL